MSLLTNLNNYWKLDESSGNASDSVGGSTLTNTNTITYAAGKINNGASLVSASSQYFTTADTIPLSITGDASWSFWIKPDTGNTDPVVFAKFKNSGQLSYYIQPNFSSNLITFVNSSNGTAANGSSVTVPSMSVGTWYHIVVVYTASTHTIEVYTQGTSRGTTATNISTSIFDGTDPLEIGRYSIGASNYFNGMIDELGIWSRAITSTEVTSLYNSGAGLQYPFYTIALDSTSAGSNSPTFATTTATWSHTCSGTNRILWLYVYADYADVTTGATFNGASMTLVNKVQDAFRWLYLFYIVNPDSGAHDIVVTNSVGSAILGMAASYTGAKQTGQPDAQNTGTFTGTSLTTSVTTVADNCWLIAGGACSDGGITAGTNTTFRQVNGVNTGSGLFDSNGPQTPAGSYSLQITSAGGTFKKGMVMASFAPSVSTNNNFLAFF